DKDNATGQVLEALRTCELPEQCRITVVMGATAPWLANIRQLAVDMPWPTTVKVNISDMAQLMADSDMAIGAAGATTWERSCLGLPTIMLVLAENQQRIASTLEQAKAAQIITKGELIDVCLPSLISPLVTSPSRLMLMSQAAANILDGNGAAAVIQYLER
ncbi:MAG: glycosyltransferase, partial [Oceanisphaera sp.]|uniref:glycosyltransferase n=1 Tax=Oceanisphaera sp. TaxID=1929979 RepID=UPI003C7428BE